VSITVIALRWAHGWELHIHEGDTEVGVTQSRTLAGADRMVRDYLALDRDAEPDSFDVVVVPTLEPTLADEVTATRAAVRDAEQAQRAAAGRSRLVARKLKASGMSGTDIASVLGVSAQRVSQLVNSAG
jgi:DNA-directed RNA polymerase specialized sigma subunit